jgi:ABC-type glycerol-3-phosphate transport system substrate-binding protein
VQTGFIEATLAGTGPDVAIGVSRGQPVNLACRGALMDLSQFEGFEELASRFSETAFVPYEYNGGTYAIPNTQGYYMMFYRKDILEKLDLEIPQTWDELLRMVPRLQKNHMEIGLPYSVISAAVAVNNGMGAKDIFPILLLQNGGDLYNEDATASALGSEVAMQAFNQWCDYYTQYGFELVYDFYTRFRNGDMPIGISDLSMYNTLVAGAPELRGEWGIVPIPGTRTPSRMQENADASDIVFTKEELTRLDEALNRLNLVDTTVRRIR